MKARFIYLSALLFVSLALASLAFAGVPRTINYQGYLKNADGVPVTATAKTLGFALYSTQSGTTPLWNESQAVKVDKGIYQVELGSAAPITLPFDTRYYLGVTVPPDQEMTPRQALTNTPYAFRAGCTPGDMMNCYTGPTGTLGIGACKSGVRTCASDGSSFGPCTGEAIPSQEVCYNTIDEDCDGKIDNGCTPHFCEPGTSVVCYSGPPGTLNVGSCHAGTTTCNGDGSAYGACIGAVGPSQEVCDGLDNDCDGITDDNLSYPSVTNGLWVCSSGAAVLLCNSGYANCVTSGACDTYTANNAQNCGGCGIVCSSGVCSNSTCQAASCADMVKNGTETDVDCGGGSCPPCAAGKTCSSASDCVSGICTGNICN